MPIGNRIIEIAYRLKDQFSGAVGKITGKLKKVERASDRSAARIEANNRRAAGSFSAIGGAISKFTGILAAVGAGAAVRSIVTMNAAFQKLHASLVTVTGSAASADDAFADIKEFAKSTPFQVGEITQAFIKLKALGLEPSMEALRSYGNTASAMGKTLDQFIETVADASVGEFERLKEFGIKARSEGDNVSLTFQGVTTTVKKEAKAIEGYLRQLGDVQFAGAMERQMATIGGAFSNLQDTFSDLAASIGEAGLNEAVTQSIKGISSALKEQKPAIVAALNGILGAFTIFFSSVRAVFNTVTAVFGGVAGVIVTLAGKIADGLSAITFGDTSKNFAKMGEEMNKVAKAIRKGMLTDLDDVKAAVSDISDVVDGTAFQKKAEETEKQTDNKRKANTEQKALEDIRRKDAEEAAKAQKGILEQETETLKEELRKRKDAYRDHLNDIKKFKEERKALEEEFSKAAQELGSDAVAEGEDLNLLDASKFEAEANQAITDGDFDQAVESARKGVEVLRQLKEQGGQSNVVMQGMAEIFRNLALEAQDSKVDAAVVDSEQAENDISRIESKIDALKATLEGKPIKVKLEVDAENVKQQVQAAVAEAQAAAPTITIKTASRGTGSSGERVFGDGTGSFEDAISNEVMQVGSK